jgi:peptidoglycan/LPS O-acetylase OafA/YrhL
VNHSARKIDNLTGIRGFAALWVAAFHFRTTPIVASFDFGSILANGYRGVDIFFVLSGLILALNYAASFSSDAHPRQLFLDFLSKRFARIYPLHFATFLLMFLAWHIAPRFGYLFHAPGINNWWTAFCNVLLIHAWGVTSDLSWNTPSWSVSAEWFAYLFIFPFCILVLRRLSLLHCVVLTFASWLLFLAFVFVYRAADVGQITNDGALRIAPEFIGGYTIFRFIQTKSGIKGNVAAFFGASSILALSYFPSATTVLLLPAIMLLMAGLYYGGGLVDAIFGNRIIVFLGEISYSIYMIHIFTLIIFNRICNIGYISTTPEHAIGIFATEIIATISIGYFAYLLIEVPGRAIATKHLRRLLLA